MISSFIKNNLKLMIGLIIGAILAGGIVYAATSANEVSYITSKNESVKNVEDALNDLYLINKNQGTLDMHTWIGSSIGGYIYSSLSLPKGFNSIIIESITKDDSVTVEYIRVHNKTKNAYIAELSVKEEVQIINLSEYKDDEISIWMYGHCSTNYKHIQLNGITLIK